MFKFLLLLLLISCSKLEAERKVASTILENDFSGNFSRMTQERFTINSLTKKNDCYLQFEKDVVFEKRSGSEKIGDVKVTLRRLVVENNSYEYPEVHLRLPAGRKVKLVEVEYSNNQFAAFTRDQYIFDVLVQNKMLGVFSPSELYDLSKETISTYCRSSKDGEYSRYSGPSEDFSGIGIYSKDDNFVDI